jgi:23S rRNA (cytidine1920-2'-O)/16S rRNA (cytidine1409-2'-O)-methyltransferase
MARQARRQPLVDVLARLRPDLDDPAGAIAALSVLVDGAVVANPRALVHPGASISVRAGTLPRGTEKLGQALDALGVDAAGAVAVDVGACTGGFTRALLDRGAEVVYAVDVGHGQLLGSLRADPRVVNLERTNVADLDMTLVPRPVDLVVVDVSKLSLGEAVTQLTARVTLTVGATLVGLVKPMFELRLGALPTDPEQIADAGRRAAAAVEAAGWTVEAVIDSAVRGNRGAIELFVHATHPAGTAG